MALKYVQRRKGVLDTDTMELITPLKQIKWRIYERWLRKRKRDIPDWPKHIFNS